MSERIWLVDDVAVCVARIDFHDPALADDPDARERGVRVEVRPVSTTATGSVYASDPVSLQPATTRYDLLESRPHAADRVHWHPGMVAGEPEQRVFDPGLSADPVGWLTSALGEHVADPQVVDEVVREVAGGLTWAREPWPAATHDERGLATG